MALNWKDKQDGVDEILAEDINAIANAVIKTQEELKNLEIPEIDLSNYYNKKETEDFVSERYTPIETFNEQIIKKQDKFSGYEGQYVGFSGITSSNAEALTPDWLPQKDSDMLITSGGVYEAIGNIETVLDGIIAIQNALIGGDSE